MKQGDKLYNFYGSSLRVLTVTRVCPKTIFYKQRYGEGRLLIKQLDVWSIFHGGLFTFDAHKAVELAAKQNKQQYERAVATHDELNKQIQDVLEGLK